MAHTSLQVCMDSSDWLQQGTMSDDILTGLDSASSPSDCMLAAACSSRAGPALMERRLRPPHDQNLKCPRCDSTHTKFCYYNNYSLTQPRYFCKTCRRYWTKGGTLRNIPVGGGCRKNNKKSTSKKSNEHQSANQGGPTIIGPPSNNPMDLHLSFPEVQFPPHLANLIGLGGANFMDGSLIRPIDFMENKYEALVGGTRLGHDFLGSNNGGHEFGIMGGIGEQVVVSGGYNGMSTVNGFSNVHDGNSAISFMDQRMLLPYEGNNDYHQNEMDVKPNTKLLSLEWQDQGCTSDVGKDSSFGYHVNGSLRSWSGHGMMGGHFQPSTTNSLV